MMMMTMTVLNKIHVQTNTKSVQCLCINTKHNKVHTRMRGKAQPDGRPAVELIEMLLRLSLIPTRSTPLFD